MDEKERIRQLIESSDATDFAPFGQGTSQAWIDRAESRLGFKLPPSYVWWAKNFGGGEIDGEEVFSIYPTEDVEASGDLAHMRDVKLKNKTAQPNQLFITATQVDEAFFFKLDEPGVDGEFPVYVWDSINGEERKYADDFLGFLERRITEAG